MNNVEKLVEMCREYMPDFIIGAGGGKALDTAKYAAEICGIPVITIPTIAATCAAASNQIIVYSDDGEYLENVYPKTNPPLVIVDPEVILRAPKKYLISGIYDSLAKWYEGSASLPGSDNADTFDYMALAIAGMLKENLFRDGKAALDALDAGELTKEFINVVNLNIYTAASVQALGIKGSAEWYCPFHTEWSYKTTGRTPYYSWGKGCLWDCGSACCIECTGVRKGGIKGALRFNGTCVDL